MWRWQLKTCWSCFCCWCWWWGLCWQPYVTDLEAWEWSESQTFVQTLSARFGQDFEIEVQARFCSLFCCWCLVEVRKFNLGQEEKRAAFERRSDILEKIFFLPEKGDSVIPFFKILNEIHYDTALFRQRDNRDFCFISDYRKRLSRTQNFKRNQSTSKISDQKRQLLIDNAFKRCYNLSSLSQNQVIDICKKV